MPAIVEESGATRLKNTARPSPPAARTAEDLELLAAFLSGRASAFDVLFRRLTPVVHRNVANAYIRHHQRPSREDLQEAVQSVWAAICARDNEVLRRFDANHPQASVRAYVARFTLWRTVDMIRARGRTDVEQPSSIDFERCTELVDRFGERAENRDYALTLITMLYSELRPKGRVALQVLFVEGLSAKEAVERTGLSEQSLRTWRRDIRRLARDLRRKLDEEGPLRTTSIRRSSRTGASDA